MTAPPWRGRQRRQGQQGQQGGDSSSAGGCHEGWGAGCAWRALIMA
ncbi:hypothetical protein [Actinomyces slackii]|nr:hypothetical protein [Actinomyces slackii]